MLSLGPCSPTHQMEKGNIPESLHKSETSSGISVGKFAPTSAIMTTPPHTHPKLNVFSCVVLVPPFFFVCVFQSIGTLGENYCS